MPAKQFESPPDWVSRADEDLDAARSLLALRRFRSSVAIHLQQAVEKYLKAYLLSTGWRLERIHNLNTLLAAVVQRAPELVRFQPLCAELTLYFTTLRYPPTVNAPTPDQLRAALEQTTELSEEVKRLLPNP